MRHVTDRMESQLAYFSRVMAQSARETLPLLERMNFLAMTQEMLENYLCARAPRLGERKRAILTQRVLKMCGEAEERLRALEKDLRKREICLEAWNQLGDKQREALLKSLERRAEKIKPQVMTQDTLLALESGETFFVAWHAGRKKWLLAQMPQRFPAAFEAGRDGEKKLLIAGEELLPHWIEDFQEDGEEETKDTHAKGAREGRGGEGEEKKKKPPKEPKLEWAALRLLREAIRCPGSGEKAEEMVRKALEARKTAPVCLLYTSCGKENEAVRKVCELLQLPDGRIYEKARLCDVPRMLKRVCELRGFDKLRYRPFEARVPDDLREGRDLFKALDARDHLLVHPYDSYDAVLRLLESAAEDEHVKEIDMTLYRVARRSRFVRALCSAAKNGCRVRVAVELRARGDEEHNLAVSERLRDAGCEVRHGGGDLTVHGKALMIVREENGQEKCYVHLATGNYNEHTAEHYVDVSLLTANAAICEDVRHFFDHVLGVNEALECESIWASPGEMRAELLRLIRREMGHAMAGRPCGIRAKLNALTDKKLIGALYAASRAGVPIELMVRGACRLQPGIKGVSDHIRVRSVVGRLLEHARVIACVDGGENEVYLSTADWMKRNLERRTEMMIPVQDEICREKLRKLLEICWQDTEDAWEMHTDEYTAMRCTQEGKCISSQKRLMEHPLEEIKV